MGKPRMYKTPEEMQQKIDAYFSSCEFHYKTDDQGRLILNGSGQPIKEGGCPPTLTGLQNALGFRSRQTMLNYRGRREFRDMLLLARSRCEQYAEERLFDRDGYFGAAWVLTYCYGWGKDGEEEKSSSPTVQILNKYS